VPGGDGGGGAQLFGVDIWWTVFVSPGDGRGWGGLFGVVLCLRCPAGGLWGAFGMWGGCAVGCCEIVEGTGCFYFYQNQKNRRYQFEKA